MPNKENEQSLAKPEPSESAPLQSDTPQNNEATEPQKLKKDWATLKKDFLASKKGKVTLVVIGVLLVLGLLFAIPVTRYAMLGVFVKKSVTLTILDSVNSRPVSAVDVTIAGKTSTTDGQGKAVIEGVPVGDQEVAAAKKYYKDAKQSVRIPVFSQASSNMTMEATGRQVPIKVINKISGAAIANATLTAAESEVATDEKGEGVLVVPADQTAIKATIKADGYNDASVDVTVAEQLNPKNVFSVTPAGKVYFLSNRTGKINVMKSDLDGTNPEVVLAGTGKESDFDTVLLASRDWKHLALKAKRDSDKAKLYHVDPATGKLSVIDEGDADFTLVGWSGGDFIFHLVRTKVQPWEANRHALKTYDASTAKLTMIEQTKAEAPLGQNGSYEAQYFNSVNIVGDLVVYNLAWQHSSNPANLGDKTDDITTVKPNGQDKKVIWSYEAKKYAYANSRQVTPQEVYYQLFTLDSGKYEYFKYQNNKVEQVTGYNEQQFTADYKVDILSPSGNYTLWSVRRDGKLTLQVGDGRAQNAKTIATDGKLVPFGWYSDDYLLLSQNGSELFILPRDNVNNVAPLKVTDYHKANFAAYGSGYGGEYNF